VPQTSNGVVYWFLKVPRQPSLIAIAKGDVGLAGDYKQPSEKSVGPKPNRICLGEGVKG
jgi:hypothetical protein